MNKANKGQIRIIESFLALIIIFSAFVVSGNFPSSQNAAGNDYLASMGFNALTKLDSSGFLGRCIDNREWSSLREALNLLLPSEITFNLTVYNTAMEQINSEIISNGFLDGKNTVFVKYICVSQSAAYRCYILHLHLTVIT